MSLSSTGPPLQISLYSRLYKNPSSFHLSTDTVGLVSFLLPQLDHLPSPLTLVTPAFFLLSECLRLSPISGTLQVLFLLGKAIPDLCIQVWGWMPSPDLLWPSTSKLNRYWETVYLCVCVCMSVCTSSLLEFSSSGGAHFVVYSGVSEALECLAHTKGST